MNLPTHDLYHMKNKKPLISFLIILLSNVFQAQAQDVEMADAMRANGKLYVVVAVMLIIFTGLAIYLFMIDRKVSRLEKEIKDKNKVL
jgi:CcmD family protein